MPRIHEFFTNFWLNIREKFVHPWLLYFQDDFVPSHPVSARNITAFENEESEQESKRN